MSGDPPFERPKPSLLVRPGRRTGDVGRQRLGGERHGLLPVGLEVVRQLTPRPTREDGETDGHGGRVLPATGALGVMPLILLAIGVIVVGLGLVLPSNRRRRTL